MEEKAMREVIKQYRMGDFIETPDLEEFLKETAGVVEILRADTRWQLVGIDLMQMRDIMKRWIEYREKS